MKRIVFFLSGVLALSVFFSCGNDEFSLVAPTTEPFPIVYGFINVNDTAHYIRVEKAFVSNTISPADLAQDPNNLYFDNATVELIKNGSTTFTMNRVDGNLEGYQREDGVFASSPNYLYKLKLAGSDRFEPGDEVTLKLTLDEVAEPVTATIKVIGGYTISSPNPLNLNASIGFNPDGEFLVSYIDNLELSYGMKILFKMNYEEKLPGEPFVDKSFDWVVTNNFTPNISPNLVIRSYSGAGIEFYQVLADNIAPAVDEIRRFKSIDISIFNVGEDLQRYNDVANSNTGITSNQIIPNYTNLSYGRGVFSSTGQVSTQGMPISESTKLALEEVSVVLPLNFQ